MFLSIQRILTVCSETCPQHALLIRNLVSVLAKKNLQLNDKITHMSKRRTRKTPVLSLVRVAPAELVGI